MTTYTMTCCQLQPDAANINLTVIRLDKQHTHKTSSAQVLVQCLRVDPYKQLQMGMAKSGQESAGSVGVIAFCSVLSPLCFTVSLFHCLMLRGTSQPVKSCHQWRAG